MKTTSRLFALSILLLVLPLRQMSAPQSDELHAVLTRASRYVEQYEDTELSNLLITEDTAQTARYFPDGNIPVARTQQRLIKSDFLLLHAGKKWIGVRKVNLVDGFKVKSSEKSFQSMLDDSPAGIFRRIEALREEASRYDIGGVLRQDNIPTFALSVLRTAESPRFRFSNDGIEKINGVLTWKVTFHEEKAPTLAIGIQGQWLFSSGILWIEPGSGRVLKTEFDIENSNSKEQAKGRTTVTYTANKKLGFYVPKQMTEHYDSRSGYVDSRADYSNILSFKVDVQEKLDSGVGSRLEYEVPAKNDSGRK